MHRTPRSFYLVFLGPALLLYTAFVAWPGLRAFSYSLQRWNGLTEGEWIGLENFSTLLGDRELFFSALGHNVMLLTVGGVIMFALALLFAAAIHRKAGGAKVYRIVFFFPNVLAAVAVALLWVLLYSTTGFGMFNGILGLLERGAQSLGLPLDLDLPYSFLTSANLMWALVPMLVWMAVGFYMLLFLAAMGSIPESYYEAARLDGATPIQQFRHITLPLLRETLVVAAIFWIISMMKFFDPVWVIENEYPNADSHVIATLLYQKMFTEYNIGYASALAVVLFGMVFSATLLSLRFSRRERLEY